MIIFQLRTWSRMNFDRSRRLLSASFVMNSVVSTNYSELLKNENQE